MKNSLDINCKNYFFDSNFIKIIEEFNEYSKQYKYNSEEVKRKIWYKDLKVIAIIILIILLIVFFVLCE